MAAPKLCTDRFLAPETLRQLNVPADGAYRLCQTQPVGYGNGASIGANGTTPASNEIVIAILPVTGLSAQNFAERPGSLAGSVYQDQSAPPGQTNNGLRDAGELGIANVPVTLTGTDARGAAVNVTVLTDAAGNYLFEGLVQANTAGYTITEGAIPGASGTFNDGIDTLGNASVAADGLYFPNGSMITPDGRTLIVGESFGNRISAFDIGADGRLGPRRDWAVFGELPPLGVAPSALGRRAVAPDGAALDAEGCVWCADAAGRRVIRVAPGGRILASISTDPMGVFACMLGGDDRRTLFICVAPDSHPSGRAPVREAQLWATTVEVPGAGWP